jgi:hypothetical protein
MFPSNRYQMIFRSFLSIEKKGKVGMTGFEPATFCTQNKHATKLRYIPSNH